MYDVIDYMMATPGGQDTGSVQKDKKNKIINTIMTRKADSDHLFRPHRIYSTDDGWYVATREGERGPFPTRQLAELDLKNYRRRIKDSTDPR